MRDGSINIQRFARDALLLGVFQIFQGAHVVQPVGQLHQHDAHVVHHGQQHFADVFNLAGFRRHHVEAADLGNAFHQPGDFRSEAFFDARQREFRVFNNVVQERGR